MTTSERQSASGLVLGVALWALGLFIIVVGFRRLLPPLASAHGVAIDRMLVFLLVATGLMILAGHVVLGYFVLRFSRAREASGELPSGRAQRTWSVIPGLLMTLVAEGGVLVLGLPALGQMYFTEPPADAVELEVTGEQFTWNVRYPGPDGTFGRTDPHLIGTENALGLDPSDPASADDIVDLAVLYLPVGRPVHVRLRSKDVLHSFYLPHFRVKQDAVPGMTIDVWFVPTREGEFELACAELCGFGHYQMRGVVHVVSQQEFDRYLAERAAAAGR